MSLVTVKPAHYVPSTIEHHVEALLLHLAGQDFGALSAPLRVIAFETDGGSDRDFRHEKVRLAFGLFLAVTGLIGVLLVKPEARGSKKNTVAHHLTHLIFADFGLLSMQVFLDPNS